MARTNIENAASGLAIRSALNAMFTELYGSIQTRVSGRWYSPSTPLRIVAGTALVANSIRLLPVLISSPITVSALATRIGTVSAGGSIDIALYAADAATLLPTGAALCSSGSLSTDTATVVSANLGANVNLSAGFYWMAVNSNNSVAVCSTIDQAVSQAASIVGSTTLSNVSPSVNNSNLIRTFAQTFGTWPDLTAQTTVEALSGASAVIFLKAA